MAGKALLAFLITATLAVAAFGMHAKHPEQIGMTPALLLGAIALASLAVASFGKPGVNAAQRARDRNGLRNVCAACGHDGTRNNPLTVDDEGSRIHVSHFSDPNSGLYRSQR